MSRDGLQVTVVGWAASTPRGVVGDGAAFRSFRVATTPRWYDSRQGAWTDGRTEWITVKLFREPAMNVAESVRKGQPLIVHGRLHTEEWTTEGVTRTGLVLEATALGHDLTRGRATFTRRVYTSGAADGAERPDDGSRPEDGVDPWAGEAPSSAESVPGPAQGGAADEPADAEEALVTS